MKYKIPELLSPAGSLEKLKVAISYGADAVYLAGLKFGLRAAADNFTYEELKEGVEFAHERGRKVYCVLNSFHHDKDFDELPDFIQYLESLKIDAVIVSDIGVIKLFRETSSIPVHLSTQISCLNVESAKMYKQLGVERIVLGREITLKEAGEIRREADIEIEVFVHGSMCMAYSGNCVISNFTQGRDSNRGGCAHSCRFEYSIDLDNDESKRKKAFFMSSKDLEGIRVLEEFIKEGLDSLKVEGRMKSNLYAGTVTKVYREALDFYAEHGHFLSEKLEYWAKELNKITHREYTEASLVNKADSSSIYSERDHEIKEYVISGMAIEVIQDVHILVEVKSAFHPGETLEVLPFSGSSFEISPNNIKTLSGVGVERTKPGQLVLIPYFEGVEKNNIIRQVYKENVQATRGEA